LWLFILNFFRFFFSKVQHIFSTVLVVDTLGEIIIFFTLYALRWSKSFYLF